MAQLKNTGEHSGGQIFDQELRRKNLARAAHGFGNHDFLHRLIIDDLVARLEMVLRDFDRALIFGPGGHLLAPALTPDCGIRQLQVASPVVEMAGLADGAALVCDEAQLPFTDGAFDLVISVMSLHMENHVPRALAQARRVLAPDGLFLAALPGGGTLRQLRDCLYQAETELTGGVSPRIIPFGEIKDLGGLLQGAGFALPVADLMSVPVTYRDPYRLLKDLQGMGEANVLTRRKHATLRRDLLTRAMAHYREKFSYQADDGTAGVLASFEIVMLTGWAPHPDQQRPLARGTGKISMAEAIEKFGKD